ncbi:ATP-binding domain-containing protein 4 [Heterocephalus glaber]|uniref:Diphthine--ammonia ligase n=1 Tax=Heterocephalus glaber TaxID=10181 RepID=G5BZS0_HETGA|nr:ATP-binding domain-containing protein 4 [Heterocephalus glaber]
MRVAALISGGKDSCYNMMQCVAAGHQIVALANLRPDENQERSDELDSYMYQTVGHQAIDLYAEAMALPLYRRTIRGRSLDTGREYTKCEGDEVEDLYELLKLVKGITRVTLLAEYDALNLQDFHMPLEMGSQAVVYRTLNELCTQSKFDKHTFPPFISEIVESEENEEVDGISVGAILSDYQRIRVENVCKRLNLQPLAYLWQRNQEDLLREMIASNIQAVIIKVAALGLDPDKHLGKALDEMEPYLLECNETSVEKIGYSLGNQSSLFCTGPRLIHVATTQFTPPEKKHWQAKHTPWIALRKSTNP